MTILAIAAAALGALAAFRRSPDPVAAQSVQETGVARIRRSTSVVLAIAEAVWTVLDALVFVTGRRVQSVTGANRAQQPRFGSQPAADVGD